MMEKIFNMMEKRPGVSLVASLKIACITVGEQITIEQLIEKCIVMRIYRQ